MCENTPLKPPLTEEQLTNLRAEAIKEYVEYLHFDPDAAFTCDACPVRYDCIFVFDAYNTGGDCLAEK